MLANLFATRRELKKLARDNNYLRGRVSSLEARNEYLSSLILERDLLFVDRILVQQRAFPIAEEASYKAQPKQPDDAELKEYLRSKQEELYLEAAEAGRTREDADRLYKLKEPEYIEDFLS